MEELEAQIEEAEALLAIYGEEGEVVFDDPAEFEAIRSAGASAATSSLLGMSVSLGGDGAAEAARGVVVHLEMPRGYYEGGVPLAVRVSAPHASAASLRALTAGARAEAARAAERCEPAAYAVCAWVGDEGAAILERAEDDEREAREAAAAEAADRELRGSDGESETEEESRAWRPPRSVARLLGRQKTNARVGLVGLPNVGKSSIHNLLTGLHVAAENYPFCTIHPNRATLAVPDTRLDEVAWLAARDPFPAILTVTDIAGLVRGASKGAGLGNAFLHEVSTAHVICHVVRAFDDMSVTHVDMGVDGARDLDTITRELVLKDLEAMEARVARMLGKARRRAQGDPVALKRHTFEVATVRAAVRWLRRNRQLRHREWSAEEAAFLGTLQMWTDKPAVVAVNVGADDYCAGGERLAAATAPARRWLDTHMPDARVVPLSVEYEERWHRRPRRAARPPGGGGDGEKREEDEEGGSGEEEPQDEDKNEPGTVLWRRAREVALATGLPPAVCRAVMSHEALPSALPALVRACYEAAGLVTVYTVGKGEGARAWTLYAGSTAADAAARVNYRWKDRLASVEAVSFDDFARHRGVVAALRDAGAVRMLGKAHPVVDGDVLLRFRLVQGL